MSERERGGEERKGLITREEKKTRGKITQEDTRYRVACTLFSRVACESGRGPCVFQVLDRNRGRRETQLNRLKVK